MMSDGLSHDLARKAPTQVATLTRYTLQHLQRRHYNLETLRRRWQSRVCNRIYLLAL